MAENTMTKNAHNPTISIIIPVYKAEKYLCECLDSIVAQTFADWECILVDDGSPDNSGGICDEYAQKDNRFTVIHKQNEGVSKARNEGLNVAKGKWISFVDSDDWIDSVTYQNVLNAVEENNADLVQWGIVLEKDGNVLREKHCKGGFIEGEELVQYFEPSTCHKLFLRRIIYDKNIKYPDGLTLSEDRYFSFLYYLYSSRVLGIKECYYHYRIYSGSSTHRMSEKNILDEVEVIKMMEKALSDAGKADDAVFRKILINQEIEAKNHALFLLSKPNYKLWRKLFPEVVPMLKKPLDKKKLLYVLLKLHLDFLVTAIIKFYTKK